MKGFTLIELLAVIVILAIILLIAMPVVLNVISEARKGGFESTAYGLLKTAENDYMRRSLAGNIDETVIYYFDEGVQTVEPETYQKLEFSGKPPLEGYIKVYQDGGIEVALTDGEWAITKNKENKEFSPIFSNEGNCCSLPEGEEEEVFSGLLEEEIISCLTNSLLCEEVILPEGYTAGNWIPVATHAELYNTRDAIANTYGVGTIWEGTYTGGLNKKYIQVANINLESYSSWEPIGSPSSNFTGEYDMNGWKVENFNIDVTGTSLYLGLFRYIGTGGKVMNCEISGDIDAHGTSTVYAGLISGSNYGLISNCKLYGGLTASNESTTACRIGGITGDNRGTIVDSMADVNVTGRLITPNPLRNGAIAGGISGENNSGIIEHSYALGNVSVHSSDRLPSVGGLVGWSIGSTAIIKNCYARGNVYSSYTGSFSSEPRSGGLVSQTQNGSTVENSYATGSATTNKGSSKGGLVAVKASTTDQIINSYYDIESSGNVDNGLGTPLTTLQMKTVSSFNNWDFDNIWKIDEENNNGYPSLR